MTKDTLIVKVRITLGEDDELIITVPVLKRDTKNRKQHNHVIPVGSFLNALKANIERHRNAKDLFKHLVYVYSLDKDKDFYLLRNYYYHHFSEDPKAINIHSLAEQLEDTIIPLIYNTWNSRDDATFEKDKSPKELGKEGSKILKLQRQFKKLNDNDNLYSEWAELEPQINEFIASYIAAIDISAKHSQNQLYNIIKDVRNALVIAINVILSSPHNDYLYITKNGRQCLPDNIENWYHNKFQLNTLGQQFLHEHPVTKAQPELAYEWHAYLQKDKSSDSERLLSDSEAVSPSHYHTLQCKKNTIEYSANNIQRILQTVTPHSIQVILDTPLSNTAEAFQSTHELTERIIRYTTNTSNINRKDYLVINCDSQSLVNSAYLARLKYNGEYWVLTLTSLVNQQIVYDILSNNEIRQSLNEISIEGCGIAKYCNSKINNARIEQVIEYAKSRIKHPKSIYTEDAFNEYKIEEDKIKLVEAKYYQDQHIEESQLDLVHIMYSPIGSQESDSTFPSPSQNIKSTWSCDSTVISQHAASNSLDAYLSPRLGNIRVSPYSTSEERGTKMGLDSPNPFYWQPHTEFKTPERYKGVKQARYYSPEPSTSGMQKQCNSSAGNIASPSKKIKLEQDLCKINSLKTQNTNIDRGDYYDYGHPSFEAAIDANDYNYPLREHDILDIARVHYGYNLDPHSIVTDLVVVGSASQFSHIVENYCNSRNTSPLIIILNLNNPGRDGIITNGRHWVTVVLNNINHQCHAYYADSLSKDISENVENLLIANKILKEYIHNASIIQQGNDNNCGLWSLENARIIRTILETNGHVETIILPQSLSQSFRELRDLIDGELRGDIVRQEHLYGDGSVLPHTQGIRNIVQPNNISQDDSIIVHNIISCLDAHAQYYISNDIRHKRSVYKTGHDYLSIQGQDFLNCTSNINQAVLGIHWIMLDRVYKNILTDKISCNEVNKRIHDIYVKLYYKLYGDNNILHSKLQDTLSNHNLDQLTMVLTKDIKNLRLLEASTGDAFVSQSVNYFDIDYTRLLLQKGASVNAKDDVGNTALYYSIEKRDYEESKLLIEYGADVNYINTYGQSSIHDCVLYDANISLMELLIEYDANINARDTKGNTPLSLALGIADSGAAEFLINHGADVNNINEDDESLLYIALTNRKYIMMEALLQRGANSNIINKNGNSLLNIAIQFHDVRAAKLLIKYGSNINYVNCDGKSILYYAVKNDLYTLIKFIVNKEKADINFVDNAGNSILDYADAYLNTKIVNYLNNKGAKRGSEIDIKTNIKYTDDTIDVKDITTQLQTGVSKYIVNEATTKASWKHIRDGGALRTKRADIYTKDHNQVQKNLNAGDAFEESKLTTKLLEDGNHHKHRHRHGEWHKRAVHQIDKNHKEDHQRDRRDLEDTLKNNDNKQLYDKLVADQEKHVRSDTDSRYDAVQHVIGTRHTIEQDASKFIDSKASPIDNSVNNQLGIDWQGNLLLGRLLFGKKCSGEKCKVIQDVANKPKDSKYAHRLAYSSYAPVIEQNIEDTELVGEG